MQANSKLQTFELQHNSANALDSTDAKVVNLSSKTLHVNKIKCIDPKYN